MSDSDSIRPSDAAGSARPSETNERPLLVFCVLALIAVFALAAAGWAFSSRQQAAFRAQQTEIARLAAANDAQRLGDNIAQLRTTLLAATHKIGEAEAALVREQTSRRAADHAVESLRAELAQERDRSGAIARQMNTDLADARETAENALRIGEKQAALERAAKEVAERAAAEARSEVSSERQAGAALQLELERARAQIMQERSTKEDAERALEETRIQLVKERNARLDAERDAARQATARQPNPPETASAQEWRSLAESDDLIKLTEFVKSNPATPESDQALRRIGELIPASEDRVLLARLIEKMDREPIAERARQRLALLQPPETKPMVPRLLNIANPEGWVTYRDPQLDFVFNYPTVIFSVETASSGQRERTFISEDGMARLHAYSGENADGKPLAAHRSAMLADRYSGAKLDYVPVRKNWFVLSGTKSGEMFYERITFTCEGKMIHGWRISYPSERRAMFDRIVEEIHRSYTYEGVPRNCR
jgi:hypothetical protein